LKHGLTNGEVAVLYIKLRESCIFKRLLLHIL